MDRKDLYTKDRDLSAEGLYQLAAEEARRLQAVLDRYAKARPEHLANHRPAAK